jgi:hypothetical protein
MSEKPKQFICIECYELYDKNDLMSHINEENDLILKSPCCNAEVSEVDSEDDTSDITFLDDAPILEDEGEFDPSLDEDIDIEDVNEEEIDLSDK